MFFARPEASIEPVTRSMLQTGPGRYEAAGVPLLPGRWRLPARHLPHDPLSTKRAFWWMFIRFLGGH